MVSVGWVGMNTHIVVGQKGRGRTIIVQVAFLGVQLP